MSLQEPTVDPLALSPRTGSPLRAGTVGSSLPVPWTSGDERGDGPDGPGGVTDVVPDDQTPSEPRPDALAQGWVRPPDGERTEALFVLAGSSMGIGRTERVTSPVWLDLTQLVNLDAIGDPVDGTIEVELSMEDGTVIGAGWTEAFCEAVVDTLGRLAGIEPAPASPSVEAPAPAAAEAPAVPEAAPTEPAPVAEETNGPDVRFDEVVPAPTAPSSAAPSAPAPIVPPAESMPPAPSVPPADGAADLPAPIFAPGPTPPDPNRGGLTRTAPSRSASLELEDVVYLGGYPGQSRRRKKCTVTMTRTGLEISGPADLAFRISWDVVTTVEVQNSDEARFRMNTKIHRDASALVVECEQGVTILLEARDCPTIALRSAINELMADLPVVVV